MDRRTVLDVSRNALCVLLIVSLAFSGLFMTACKRADPPSTEPVETREPDKPASPPSSSTQTPTDTTKPAETPSSGSTTQPTGQTTGQVTDPGSSSTPVNPPGETDPDPPATSDPPGGGGTAPPVVQPPVVVTPPVITTPPALFPAVTEKPPLIQPNLAFSATGRSLVQLDIRPTLTLYASSGPGKPTSLPGSTSSIPIIGSGLIDTGAVFVETKPYYTSGHRAAFVRRGGDEKLWFATLLERSGVSRVVWQVADMPFEATEDDWRSPKGLLLSGEISGSTREFALDFATIHSRRKNPFALALSQDLVSQLAQLKVGGKYVNPKQTSYFVRAVPLDSSGKIMGSADRGIEIIYGDRITYQPRQSLPFELLFDLLPARRQGEPVFSGEILNDFHAADEKMFESAYTSPYYFRPQGFPKTTDTILIQVSRNKLPTSTDNWRDPAALVYELELKKGMPLFDELANSRHGIPVDFNSFGRSLLGSQIAMLSKNVEFHIRAVALYPGQDAGTVRAAYSRSVKVIYGRPDTQITYYPPPQAITPLLPTARIKEYQPVKWEDANWMYYYEVVRHPTYGDYVPKWFQESMGVKATDLVPGMTVGTVIRLQSPGEKDQSWLEQAWEAVTSYFNDLVGYLGKVVNWVSATYAKTKADLVKFVAQNMPLLPQNMKDKLEKELAKYLDYGLMYMGIPPSLPNFDMLTSMGVDYLAATALDYAGVPATDFSKEMLKDLSGGIYKAASDNAKSGTAPNPLDWNFVRQWPETMYRPAYILLELHNPHNTVTPSATLDGRIFRNITQAELNDANILSLVSAFGNSKYFELYLPVRDVRVPRMLPGQTLTIPIYFTEYTGTAYPFHPARVTQNQFLSMYNHFGYFEFSFTMRFDLPTAQEYAKQINLPQDRGYEYSTTELSIYYKGDPTKVHKK